MMNSRYQPALFWFAVFTAFTTFMLIGLGGLVTSNEAGMSVPDWPTSYGYNMFALPIQFWQGGVIYEHTHRLLASFLGVLVVALMRWLGGYAARKPLAIIGGIEVIAGIAMNKFSPSMQAVGYFLSGIGGVVLLAAVVWVRNTPSNRMLVVCGWWAFALVQLQGLLGGLRVAMVLNWLGVPHGAVAQTFLVLTCAIALFLSRWWQNSAAEKQVAVPRGLRSHVLYLTILIFIQLLIAATMRHQHAGLAIWDFPLAHGQVWPATTPEAIADYNAHRPAGTIGNPITAFQVDLQMVHRLVAYLIFLGVAAVPFMARKKLGGADGLTKFAWFWLVLLSLQIVLGAATVLSNKAADVATGHVMVGALALLTGALWWLVAVRRTKVAA
jgi:cytochrome c oxidase assembly protein subunit 15